MLWFKERSMKQKIVNYMMSADFRSVYELLTTLNAEQQRDIIVGEAAISDSIAVLGFAEYLISRENNIQNHETAALAYIQMCHINGAYEMALFHAREMHHISPDTDTKKFLLFFHGIPEKLLPHEEAVKLAQEILLSDPSYAPAKEILHNFRT